MEYQALIFDFNGVLLWDSPLQKRAWKEFSHELRGYPLTDEEIDEHVHGRNNSYSLEYVSGRSLSLQETHELTQQKEAGCRRLIRELGDDFKLSPGAIELLDFLCKNNIPHTIATASEIVNMKFFFDELDLYRWFSFDLMVYDDGSRPGKPAPDIYLQAADNLHISPQDCVVVEDSLSGIRAAAAAGIGCVVALGPAETHDSLSQMPGVDRVIENLGQLPHELFLLE